jgi:undecaprenyl-diphosphatase
MTIWLALLLGLTQGLTEFLPVSSSGHLLLFQRILRLPADMLLFDIILHIATLCAVIIVFRKKIWHLIKNPFCKTNIALLIATVITCTMVVLFKDTIDRAFTYRILPFTFMITAVVLFLTSFLSDKGTRHRAEDKAESNNTYKTAVAAGFAQGLAVIPGISRSGSTIAAALFTGTRREDAAEFSFLLSITIIVASFLYEIISKPVVLAVAPVPLVFAFLAAMVSGIFAIKFMLRIVKNIKLYWFSAYLCVLAVVLLFVF